MKKITQEYLNQIKKDLDCVGVFIAISECQLPCPDTRAGIKCEGGHALDVAGDGISRAVITDVLTNNFYG